MFDRLPNCLIQTYLHPYLDTNSGIRFLRINQSLYQRHCFAIPYHIVSNKRCAASNIIAKHPHVLERSPLRITKLFVSLPTYYQAFICEETGKFKSCQNRIEKLVFDRIILTFNGSQNKEESSYCIQLSLLPSMVKSLAFTHTMIISDKFSIIPLSIQELNFYDCNQVALNDTCLWKLTTANHLRRLTLPNNFTRELRNYCLPLGLEYLNMGRYYNHAELVEEGNHILPSTLTELVLPEHFHHCFSFPTLPPGLCKLDAYELNVDRHMLPQSLKTLIIRDDNSHVVSVPSSLTSLTIAFNNNIKIPLSLTELIILNITNPRFNYVQTWNLRLSNHQHLKSLQLPVSLFAQCQNIELPLCLTHIIDSSSLQSYQSPFLFVQNVLIPDNRFISQSTVRQFLKNSLLQKWKSEKIKQPFTDYIVESLLQCYEENSSLFAVAQIPQKQVIKYLYHTKFLSKKICKLLWTILNDLSCELYDKCILVI